MFKSNFHVTLIFFSKISSQKDNILISFLPLRCSEPFLLWLPPDLNCSNYKSLSPMYKILESAE